MPGGVRNGNKVQWQKKKGKKCYIPRVENTRINQATGAAQTSPQTAPTGIGTQSQWCHGCQRLPDICPSQQHQHCKHRCFVSQAFMAADRLSKHQEWINVCFTSTKPTPNAVSPVLAEMVTAIQITSTLLISKDALLDNDRDELPVSGAYLGPCPTQLLWEARCEQRWRSSPLPCASARSTTCTG